MRSLVDDIVSGVRAYAPSRFPYARFALALAIGIVGSLIFVWLRTPLPWLLGAMTTTTIAALLGVRIAAPGVVRTPMLVVVGVMVGATFKPDIFANFGLWWPTVLLLLAMIAVSSVVCITYLERLAGFDRPTAFYSGMPGGLIEMITLAEEHHGDLRAIALVHSVRILVIVFALPFIVSIIEGVVVQTSSVPRPSILETGFEEYLWLAGTSVVGIVVGYLLRMPAVYLLGPMLVSAAIHVADLSEFTMPVEILNFAQYIVGTTVGCRFVGVASRTIFRVFAISAGMSAVLLVLTAVFAYIGTLISPYGFVPIFIAFAPAGTPEMSLVAIAIHIEVAFVVCHHIVRLFVVMGGASAAYELLEKVRKPAKSHGPPF
jgi:membrane AbrB-like protein